MGRANPAAAGIRARDGRLPLHVALERRYSNSVISKLIEAHPNGSAVVSPCGKSPLFAACVGRYSNQVVSRLIQAYPRAAIIPSPHGEFPLHAALANRYSDDVVTELIAAHPGCIAIVPLNGKSPLLAALHNGYSNQMVSRFVDAYPDAAAIAFDGELPLHAALERRCSEVVVMKLVSANPSGIANVSPSGKSALFLACEGRYSNQLVSQMIQAHPAAAAIASTDGCLPLHMAIIKQYSDEVVLELQAAYPDGTNIITRRVLEDLDSVERSGGSVKIAEACALCEVAEEIYRKASLLGIRPLLASQIHDKLVAVRDLVQRRRQQPQATNGNVRGGMVVKCPICLEEAPGVALIPCGHTICHMCSDHITGAHSPTCPCCRVRVTGATQGLYMDPAVSMISAPGSAKNFAEYSGQSLLVLAFFMAALFGVKKPHRRWQQQRGSRSNLLFS